MQRKSIPSPSKPDAQDGISRRAMLGTVGLAATAAILNPTTSRAEDIKENTVPAPVYSPTKYRREINLQGKNVVITGASRGIGRATALELLSAGANVWGTSRTPANYPAITEYPLLPLNLEDPLSIGAFVQTIGAATGARVELKSSYPNVFAVIPKGPDSTAEAAGLSLMLATRQKEELQFGAMTWAYQREN